MSATVILVVLSAPTGVSVVNGEPGPVKLYGYTEDGTVTLIWDPPTWEGASPVSSYHVYRMDALGAIDWVAQTTGTGYSQPLDDEDEITLWFVTAENVEGEGPLSNPIPTRDDAPKLFRCPPVTVSLNPPGASIDPSCIVVPDPLP